jgi:hypothetical protein
MIYMAFIHFVKKEMDYLINMKHVRFIQKITKPSINQSTKPSIIQSTKPSIITYNIYMPQSPPFQIEKAENEETFNRIDFLYNAFTENHKH